jgi:hypothetical protein
LGTPVTSLLRDRGPKIEIEVTGDGKRQSHVGLLDRLLDENDSRKGILEQAPPSSRR